MKLTLVLRDKKNALKLSTKTIESFIERIKTDTKDRTEAMRALHQHESYYFGPTETQEIQEWNRRFSVKTAAEQFFLDYFEPATDEKDGQWISASAIFSYLKEEVGVTLLKPVSLPVFGRKLTNLPGLQKRVTKYNTEYLVKRKK